MPSGQNHPPAEEMRGGAYKKEKRADGRNAVRSFFLVLIAR